MSSDSPDPCDQHTVIPYLLVRDAQAAIAYYTDIFGARENDRYTMPDGKIGHADLSIGHSIVMLAEEIPDNGFRGPQTLGGSPVSFTVYVDNTDDVFARAVDAGATVDRPVADQFYGLRTGCITDPFGHRWMIAQRVEEVTEEEAHRRFDQINTEPE